MSKTMIVSIGEAMVELSNGSGSEGWRMGFAGDTLNTAWYLRRLLGDRWPVAYLTRVGAGAFSTRLLAFLAGEGLETAFVSRDPEREVGLYAITLRDGERSFSYWRDNSAARRLADAASRLDPALSQAGISYFSGITLAILPDVARDILLCSLKRARAAGTSVVFDPNLRPALWADARSMRRWVSAASAISDLVLPSFHDEQAHFSDRNERETIDRYRGYGAVDVVVKAGGGPVHYSTAQGAGMVNGLIREMPVDTTAAGDSFNAGYIAARLCGESPEGAIRAAHDLSRRVVMHHGALVAAALPDRDVLADEPRKDATGAAS